MAESLPTDDELQGRKNGRADDSKRFTRCFQDIMSEIRREHTDCSCHVPRARWCWLLSGSSIKGVLGGFRRRGLAYASAL